MVPKIFAYLVFSFGFVGKFMGPNEIIPSLLIVPLILSMLRALVYFLFNRKSNFRWSLLFGLSTMYTLNEHNFDCNMSIKSGSRKMWMHIFYDSCSIIETATMTGLGVHYMEDENFDKAYFTIILSFLILFGILFKVQQIFI